MELLKLVVARRAPDAIRVMADSGLLMTILGGVPYLASFERMSAIEAALGNPPDPIRRLAALSVAITEDAERLFERLRLSNAEHDRLGSMADGWWRIDPNGMTPREGRAQLYRLGALRFADRVLLAFSRSQVGPNDSAWRDLVTLPARWQPPVCPIMAADLIARGLPRGPALGAALRDAEAAWIAADFPTDPMTAAAIADQVAANHRT
jgi:poly(A) polymerase